MADLEHVLSKNREKCGFTTQNILSDVLANRDHGGNT